MDFLSVSANLPFTEPSETARILFPMPTCVSGSKTRGQECISGWGAFLLSAYATCCSKWKLHTRISRVSRDRMRRLWHLVPGFCIDALLSSRMSNWHVQTKQINFPFKTEILDIIKMRLFTF